MGRGYETINSITYKQLTRVATAYYLFLPFYLQTVHVVKSNARSTRQQLAKMPVP
jgi:hypothetical protein